MADGKRYPVPFDFKAHQEAMRMSSNALWKMYMRSIKENTRHGN